MIWQAIFLLSCKGLGVGCFVTFPWRILHRSTDFFLNLVVQDLMIMWHHHQSIDVIVYITLSYERSSYHLKPWPLPWPRFIYIWLNDLWSALLYSIYTSTQHRDSVVFATMDYWNDASRLYSPSRQLLKYHLSFASFLFDLIYLMAIRQSFGAWYNGAVSWYIWHSIFSLLICISGMFSKRSFTIVRSPPWVSILR